MTQEILISARGLPGPELESLLENASSGSEVLFLKEPSTGGERSIDPTVAVAVVQAVSAILVPFVVALAAKLFQKEPEAKLEVKQPDAPGAAAPTVIVIVSSQSPEERERLLNLHLPDAAGVEIVLPA